MMYYGEELIKQWSFWMQDMKECDLEERKPVRGTLVSIAVKDVVLLQRLERAGDPTFSEREINDITEKTELGTTTVIQFLW